MPHNLPRYLFQLSLVMMCVIGTAAPARAWAWIGGYPATFARGDNIEVDWSAGGDQCWNIAMYYANVGGSDGYFDYEENEWGNGSGTDGTGGTNTYQNIT